MKTNLVSNIITCVKPIILTICLFVLLYQLVDLAEPAKATPTDTGVWIVETVDALNCFTSGSPELVIDNDGNLHVGTENGIYAFKDADSGDWFTETITSGVSLQSMVIDNNGHLHASLKSGQDIVYAFRNDMGWEFENIDRGWNSSLAIDSNEELHISYLWEGAFPPSRLKYAYTDVFDVWHTTFITDAIDVNLAQIGLDSNDYPHILYNPVMSGLGPKHVYKNASSWNLEDIPYYGSFILDDDDEFHISFYFPQQEMVYAHSDNSIWLTETIDSGFYFNDPSLVLDNSSYAHIGYHDASYLHEAIKYAYQDAVGWHVEFVDNGIPFRDDRYSGSSLALDTFDRPHMVYSYGDSPSCDEVRHAYRIMVDEQVFLPVVVKP